MYRTPGVLTVRELLRVLIEAPPDQEVWVNVGGENVGLVGAGSITHCNVPYTRLTVSE